MDIVTQDSQYTSSMSKTVIDDMLTEYADVFEGLRYLAETYHIEIDPTAQPVRYLLPLESMGTVIKPNKLRIYIDPKDLNRAIKRPHYPLPTVEEVATSL